MTRRVIATALWAYFGWYLAAHLTALVDAPSAVAMVGGLLMAALASIDLRHRLRAVAGRGITTGSSASAER